MEQKKTLWIIAAVGVFLLVVLGAAVILYNPTIRPLQTVASTSPVKTSSSNGWISLAPAETIKQNTIPAINEPSTQAQIEQPAIPLQEPINTEDKSTVIDTTVHVGELTVYADKASFYNTGSQENVNEVNQNQVPQTIINNTTTIDLNTYEKPSFPVRQPQEAYRQPYKPAKEDNKKIEKPAVTQKPQPQKTQVETAKPQVKPQTQTPAKPEKIQYWVQVTSLSSRKNADNAREILSENKISADVFTYTDNKNQLFYRVRVGPYTTKSEAEYWRVKISEIDTFKSSASYVASTKVSE